MKIKECYRCKIKKFEDCFYVSRITKDKLNSWCKKCYFEYSRTDKERDRKKEYARNARFTGIYDKGKESSEYRKINPEKVLAHYLTNIAIKNKKIKRSPCEKCGATKVHAHHDNYREIFKVRFLCPIHHKEIH